MKNYFFFLSFIPIYLFLGCSEIGFRKKPKNLINEKKMEQIIYDATVMDIMSSFSKKNPNFESLMGKSYLFEKYNIDSLNLSQSESYYAKNPRLYYRMHKNVIQRINNQKDSIAILEKEIMKN